MAKYVIFTDSACDIDLPSLEKWKVKKISPLDLTETIRSIPEMIWI